ncbi:matrixin family metalloprotease [Paraliomyxa miuraensis]|uniref:matrixin family metalloprotease n=1 Tax=Paraliomyxa miuraensis TaxID=376150 RepID=UPI00225BFD12|nr:matrixin family metalloprotease [Paraliomyxa miuraensis]MCX4239706.1 hypothetical protein [Paraliomyxa miuraensis]
MSMIAWLLLPWLAADPPLAGPPDVAAAEGTRRATVYLDFGGGWLSSGSDSSLGQATCAGNPLRYPIFLGSERAAELAVAEARRLVAPYGVRVVSQRPPPHLPYAHVRVGGHPDALGLDPKLNGLACDVDCDDAAHRDTVFMFAEKWVPAAALEPLEEEARAVQVGRIAIHEVAHSWGLEHSGGTESVMARFPSAGVPGFVEGCMPLDLDHDSECPDARTRYCDEGHQDAHAELLALFGDGSADTVPPHAAIVWPPDGYVLEPGQTLEVEVEVGDDHGGFGWMLEVPELHWEHVARDVDETSLRLVVPQGRFTLRLEVLDHDRNVGEAEVSFEARWPEEGEQEPAEPSATCACRQGGPGRWWIGWSGLVLAMGSILRGRPTRAAGSISTR